MSGEPFGVALRRLRERAGLTQEELAERAELSANAVSALERGVRNRPHRHTRDALATALGVTPAERASWDAAVAPRFPRAPLPVAPSPLLGRGPDVQEVVRLLATERIVTLTGPGGVGKTRLALAVAERASYRDGVVFVPLAAVADPGDVLPAVAHALGLRHGRVAAVLSEAARADALLTRSVRIFGELGDTWGMAHQLTHLADTAAQRGDHTRAALLYGAVDALTEQFGAHVFQVWQDLSDQCQAAAMAALGVERFTALRRQGRALRPADVVSLAVFG